MAMNAYIQVCHSLPDLQTIIFVLYKTECKHYFICELAVSVVLNGSASILGCWKHHNISFCAKLRQAFCDPITNPGKIPRK